MTMTMRDQIREVHKLIDAALIAADRIAPSELNVAIRMKACSAALSHAKRAATDAELAAAANGRRSSRSVHRG